MPLLNFMKQFAPDVESGIKKCTIRRDGKRKYRVGDTAYLYTGARTKYCRKLGEEIITSVTPIEINEKGMKVDGITQTLYEAERIAIKDGFKTLCEMLMWFERVHGLPFKGNIISWE